MHELIQLYHRACAQCIEKMDGFITKYLGDGVLAYFGYPSAHEDAAERSIRAGLLIAESVPRLATRHRRPTRRAHRDCDRSCRRRRSNRRRLGPRARGGG